MLSIDTYFKPGNDPVWRPTILALPSDTHCGSTSGLIPDWGCRLPTGGRYYPSSLQKLINQQWIDCWKLIREIRSASETTPRLIVAFNGDAVDGDHHNTSEIISRSMYLQTDIFRASLDMGFQIAGFDRAAGDRYYHIGGTPSHSGEYADFENLVAREMGAEPAFDDLIMGRSGSHINKRIKLDINGVLFNIAHQGPSTGIRIWTRGNQIRYNLRSYYLECIESGIRIPRYIVRSHRHNWIHPERHIGNHGTIEAFTTACFQGPTYYVHKIISTLELSNIGMLIFLIDEFSNSAYKYPHIDVKINQEVEL